MRVVEVAARELSLAPEALGLGDAGELKEAFETLAQGRDTALLALPDVFHDTNRESITRLANENGLPAIYPFRFFALAGGLVSYPDSIRSIPIVVQPSMQIASCGGKPCHFADFMT